MAEATLVRGGNNCVTVGGALMNLVIGRSSIRTADRGSFGCQGRDAAGDSRVSGDFPGALAGRIGCGLANRSQKSRTDLVNVHGSVSGSVAAGAFSQLSIMM